MRRVFSFLILFLLVITFLPFGTHAQAPTADCTNPISLGRSLTCAQQLIAQPGGLSTSVSVSSLLQTIINWLLSLVAVLALLALIVGGVMYILSFGSEDAAKRAKRIIMYAIIGLLVVFLSFAILSTVQSLLAPAPTPATPPPAGGPAT